MPRGNPTTPFQLRLQDAILAAVRAHAASQGQTVAEYVRAAILASLNRDYAVFLSDEPPTAFEIAHAGELVKKHGWQIKETGL